VFVVRLILAPYQLDQERERELSERDAQLRRFARVAPDLEIFFEKRHPMWWIEERWCRVGVRNRSTTGTARSVKLSVKQMQPGLLPFNALPSRLGEKGADPSQECSLGPSAETFFDVVRWAKEISDTFTLWIVEGQNGPGQSFNLPVGATCELTLELTADEITPRHATVRLARPDKGEPTFELVQPEVIENGFPSETS